MLKSLFALSTRPIYGKQRKEQMFFNIFHIVFNMVVKRVLKVIFLHRAISEKTEYCFFAGEK